MHYDEYCCHIPNKLVKDIEEDPKKWILSLPMFEYIHDVAYETYIRFGGSTDLYNELFNVVISPILEEYHRELHSFRFEMRILRKKYKSEEDRCKHRSDLIRHMFSILNHTRRTVRHKYAEFVNERILQITGPES